MIEDALIGFVQRWLPGCKTFAHSAPSLPLCNLGRVPFWMHPASASVTGVTIRCDLRHELVREGLRFSCIETEQEPGEIGVVGEHQQSGITLCSESSYPMALRKRIVVKPSDHVSLRRQKQVVVENDVEKGTVNP